MCRTRFRHILTNYTRIDFAIIPEKGFKKPSSYILVNDDGEDIRPETLRDYLMNILMRRESSDFRPGENVERIRLVPDNLNIVDTDTGANGKVRQINLVAYSLSEEIDLHLLPSKNLN